MSEKYELMQEVGIFIPTIFSAELIDKDGNKRTTTEVIIEEQYFAESKSASSSSVSKERPERSQDTGFYPIDENIEDDDLPF